MVRPRRTDLCNFSALAGKRIGVPRNNTYEVENVTFPIIDAFNAALKFLEAAGATTVDPINYTAWDAFFNSSSETFVLDTDFVSDLRTHLDQLVYNSNGAKTLVDVSAITHAFEGGDGPDRNTASWVTALNLTFDNTSPESWEYYRQVLYFGGNGG
jgi:amidase